MTTTSRLGAELRRRYGTPANVLKKLGLDAEMLGSLAVPPPPPSPRHGGGEDDENGEGGKMSAARRAAERVMDGWGTLLTPEQKAELLEECFSAEDGRRELAGDDEDDEERRQKLATFLRQRGGLSEDDIKTALDFAAGRPENNFQIEGERGRGSQLAGDAAFRRRWPEAARIAGEGDADRSRGWLPSRLAGDAARPRAATKKFNEKYPGIDRIQSI